MKRRLRNDDGGDPNAGDYIREAAYMVGDATLASLQKALNQRVYNLNELRVPLKAGKSIFGFGTRVIVPSDEIHVVQASGRHFWSISNESEVYGSAAGEPTHYWRNKLTSAVGLRTITFVVPIADAEDEGVQVFDSGNVPYTVEAFVVARVDTENAIVAATKVADDIYGLAATIREVTEAVLLESAAKFTLEEVRENRQLLRDAAQAAVDVALKDIGYKLSLVRIGKLGGKAHDKLVEQANAKVIQATTKEINQAELETKKSNELRSRIEAEENAATRKKTEAERLAADEAVREAELRRDETVKARENELALADEERRRELAQKEHEVELEAVQLQKAEDLARKEAAADADEIEQRRAKKLEQDAAEADALREELVQQKRLERAAAAVEQDAKRLEREETAAADRAARVKTTQAKAEADALEIETEANAQARLRSAKAEADASKDEADAKIKMAEANRAEAAAEGLAASDVRTREIENEQAQTKVDRQKGLDAAEIKKQEAEAELLREKGLADIEVEKAERLGAVMLENPAVLQLELRKLELTSELERVRIEAETQRMVAQAMSQNMHINANIFGDGGSMGKILSQIMSLTKGATLVGEEIPAVGNLLNGNGAKPNGSVATMGSSLIEKAQGLLPYIMRVIDEASPTMLGTMTVRDLTAAVAPLITGKKDLSQTLAELKEDTNFRMIGSLPVSGIMSLLGLSKNDNVLTSAEKASSGTDTVVAAATVNPES